MFGVVHAESNHAFCQAPSRLSEHHSRRGVQTYEGSLGLETYPGLFQRIVETFGPIEVDLFESRLTYQVPRFFSWKPNPPGTSNRCLLTKMESVSGICKSTMGVNCLSTVRSSVPEGQCGFDSSSMENAGIVSYVVVTSGRVSILSTSTQGSGVAVHPIPPPFQRKRFSWPLGLCQGRLPKGGTF